MTKKANLLIVEDDPQIAQLLNAYLSEAGHDVCVQSSAAGAIHALQENRSSYDAVITDLHLEEEDSGMKVLSCVRRECPETPVILVTGHATIQNAVEAMKTGAFHYLAKPFQLTELASLLERALQQKKVIYLPEKQAPSSKAPAIIGRSPAVLDLLSLAEKIALSDASVMVTGETGTGKDLFAKLIHARSKRAKGPFVAINCAAIPEMLLESELFGYAAGAFTGASKPKAGLFQEASGGTLFMDEIGEMPLALQAKLLRVVEEKSVRRLGENKETPVNVRVVCATNRNLLDHVKEGKFRQDLYYRLSVLELHIPPLRERKEDIPLLVDFFLKRFSGKPVGLSPEAGALLVRHGFPGNIRELENILERTVALSDKPVISPEDLPIYLSGSIQQRSLDILPEDTGLRDLSRSAEKDGIISALKKHDGNVTLAAKHLGISRTTLWRKMKQYGIEE